MQNHPPSPRFFAIVPAAGRSARMGQPKLLLPWGERTLIEHVLATWRASGVTNTTIVVHPADTELADKCHRAGVEVVTPPHPPADMKASIGHALAHVAARFTPCDADAWLVAPADMPGVSAPLINQVIAAHNPRSRGSWCRCARAAADTPCFFPGR